MATVLSLLLDSFQRVLTPDKCILASFAEVRQAFYLKLDLHHKSGAVFVLSYEQLRVARVLSAKKKKKPTAQLSSALLVSNVLVSLFLVFLDSRDRDKRHKYATLQKVNVPILPLFCP